MSSSSSNLNASFVLTDEDIGLLSFVNILFSIVGSLGNVFVCFTFVAYPGLRNTINKFTLSLACSDLLVCLVAQPMFVVSLVKRYQQKNVSNAFEDTRKMVTWVSLLASAGNLLGVTFERYIAIVNPLSYRGNDRQRFMVAGARTWLFVLVVWVVAISFGASTRASPTMKLVGQIYVFVVVICLILPLYCRLLCIAWKHKGRILTRMVCLTVNNPLAMPASRNRSTTASRTAIHRDTKRNPVKTVGVICGVFIVCWFPLFVLPFIYRSTESNGGNMVFRLFQWVNTLALCSSAINPIVYSWTDRKFRKALKTVYGRWVVKRLVLSQLRSENTGYSAPPSLVLQRGGPQEISTF